MAKYLDYNGLLYFWQKIKAKFSIIGHTHTISVSTGDSVTVGTAFTVPNISVSNKSIPNVTSVGSACSATVADGVLTLTANTVPTLGTAISVGSASAGTAFTIPNISKKTVVTSVTSPTGASTN